MRKKVLFVASIDKHITHFHIPSLKWFSEKGFEVHVACKGFSKIQYCDKVHQLEFSRTPYSLMHFKVLNQLKELFETEKFYLVHCHTTVAGILTRIAGNSFRKSQGMKLLFTSHGFHFFKGSPCINWLIFYPIEKFVSRYQDCLITINSEDYHFAKNYFYCNDVRLIPGMGVSEERFRVFDNIEKLSERKIWDIASDAKVIIYVAEFTDRKNHRFIIESAKGLKIHFPELLIMLPGRGELWNEMIKLAESLGVSSFVRFPGFINNIESLIACSNIGVSSCKREGLGLHLVEAMMCGLPVIATDNSGHREIIKHGSNGFLYKLNDNNEFNEYVIRLFSDNTLYTRMSKDALKSALRFEMKNANQSLSEIYTDFTQD